MKEETLIKMLIIIGAISICVIAVADTFIASMALRFTSNLAPYFLCDQISAGNYSLAEPTSYDVCNEVNRMKNFIRPEICEGFDGEKKTACLGLVEIAQNRTIDCLTILTGKPKTSVNPMDVERYCKIMNVTFPNASSSE